MLKSLRLWSSLVLVAVSIGILVSPIQKVSAFAGGTGSSASPYQISTCAELLNIDDTTANLSKAYEFSNNVDCSGTSVVPMANGSTYFSGVLNGNNFSLTGLNITCTTGWGCALFLAVSGTAEIKNLTVVGPTINSTGHTSNMMTAVLVAYSGSTWNPTFSNITISGGLIDAGVQKASGTAAAGSIAASIYRGTVIDSTSSATVRGSRYVGGLVGLLGDQNETCSAGSPSLSGSSYSGNVSGSSYVGGLVGEFGPNNGKNICEIRNSFNSGTVTGTVGGTATACSIIGGIVGQLWEATVEDSYNTGGIDGSTNTCDDVGGVVGWARGNALSNSAFNSPTLQRLYSTGSVSGRSRIGGIVGTCDRGELLVSHSTGAITSTGFYAGGLAGWSSCLVSDSYSRSNVSGSSYAGGLIGGISYYGVSRSYSTSASRGLVAFISSSPSASCVGSFWDTTLGSATSLCGASGKTTTEMKTVGTFTASSWNFNSGSAVWTIDPAINDGYPFHSSTGVDLVAPTALWTEPATPSSSRTLIFTLTFSEVVSSIAAGDFSLTGTATGCAVTPAASTANVAVTVSVTCTSDGTVIVRLGANSVSDAASNTGPTSAVTASTVTIDTSVNTTSTSSTTTVAPAGVPATTTPVMSPTTVATGQGQIPMVSSTTSIPPRTGTASASTSSTSVPSSSTVPQLSSIDLPRTKEGGSGLLLGGKEVEAVIVRENNRLVITAGPLVVRIWAVAADGSRLSLDDEGRLRVNEGDSVTVNASGFTSDSKAEVRLYSTPILLGRTNIDGKGELVGSYEIPEGVENGKHNVVLVGERNGEDVVMSLSVVLGNEPGGRALTVAVVFVLLLAVTGALLIPAIVRRRREEVEA